MARKRRGHRRNPSRRRRHRRNPGYGYNPASSLSIKQPIKAVTAGFSVPMLKKAGILSAGAIADGLVTGALNNYVVGNFAPSLQSNQYAQYGLGLVGALGAAVAPRYASDLMTGAVVKVVADVINGLNISGVRAFSGMRDFLTQRQVNNARAMGDFLVQKQVNNARTLSGMCDDSGETF